MTATIHKYHRTIHVLLVEDNPGDVALIQQVFKSSRRNIKIIRAKDGEEAMDYLQGRGFFEGTAKPDLVLLDLNMPKKSGFEVLEEIKTDPELRGIPVVILTHSALEEDVRKAYEARANFYLVKPASFDELFTAIRRVENLWLSHLESEPD